jgi:hypothetical protein
VVRHEEHRPVARHVVETRHLDAAEEKADEKTDEPEDGALHGFAATASFAGNRTFRNAPIAKTRTTNSTASPAR